MGLIVDDGRPKVDQWVLVNDVRIVDRGSPDVEVSMGFEEIATTTGSIFLCKAALV